MSQTHFGTCQLFFTLFNYRKISARKANMNILTIGIGHCYTIVKPKPIFQVSQTVENYNTRYIFSRVERRGN